MIYAIILVIVAVSGYVYAHADRTVERRLAWHANRGGLYYRYTAYGIVWVVIGFLIYLAAYKWRPGWLVDLVRFFGDPFIQQMPDSWPYVHMVLGVSVSSLIAALFFGHAIGRIKDRVFSKLEFSLLKRQIEKEQDDYSRVMMVAFEHRIPVSITLDNRKVYVGIPARLTSPYAKNRWLSLHPFLSGYRSPARHELVFTTNYLDGINDSIARFQKLANPDARAPLYQEDFIHLIDLDRIVSFNLFSIETYKTKVLKGEGSILDRSERSQATDNDKTSKQEEAGETSRQNQEAEESTSNYSVFKEALAYRITQVLLVIVTILVLWLLI